MKKPDAEILYLKKDDTLYYRLMVYSRKLYINNAVVLLDSIDRCYSVSDSMIVVVALKDCTQHGINCRSEEDKEDVLEFLNKILKLKS